MRKIGCHASVACLLLLLMSAILRHRKHFPGVCLRVKLVRMETSRRLLIGAQLLLVIVYAVTIFSSERLIGSDFAGFYTGWAMVLDGQGPKLYDLELQRGYQAQVVGKTNDLSS